MADVFVSYARSDRGRVQPLIDALEGAGLTVWWDREIVVGWDFEHVIEREIQQAKCVLVVWSHASVRSRWVFKEAYAGLERAILVPVSIDSVSVPMAFGHVDTAPLNPPIDIGDEQAKRVLARVSNLVARSAPRRADAAEPVSRESLTRSAHTARRVIQSHRDMGHQQPLEQIALHNFNQGTPVSVQRALEYFDEIVHDQPRHYTSLWGCQRCCSVLALMEGDANWLAEANKYVDRAWANGIYLVTSRIVLSGRLPEIEQQCRPRNDAGFLERLRYGADILLTSGLPAEALVHLEHAQQLAPLHADVILGLARAQMCLGNVPKAIDLLEQGLTWWPQSFMLTCYHGFLSAMTDDTDSLRRALPALDQSVGGQNDVTTFLRGELLRLDAGEAQGTSRITSPTLRAVAALRRGDMAGSVAHLQQAVQSRDALAITLAAEFRSFTQLRDHPDFARLCDQINVGDRWRERLTAR